MPDEHFTSRLEVARAIALTTDQVTVDLRSDSFTTKPADLFHLRFNDQSVGITDCLKGNCPSKDLDTVVCPSGF